MKIYTRTGDDGTTSLVGGERINKNSDRLEAYGTVDELISWIGLIAAQPETKSYTEELTRIQDKLMHCAALLATGKGARTDKMIAPKPEDITSLEDSIDRMESGLQPLNSFLLPGGSIPVANIHISRTVCRRAERYILKLSPSFELNPLVVKYINRLSDYLFVLSRQVASETGNTQTPWNT